MIRWQYTSYILPLLIAGAVSAAVALFAWRRRPTPGAAASALLMLAAAEWSLGYALELASADLPSKVFWGKVACLGVVIIPVASLAFVLQYTSREKWLTRRNVILLAIEPLVTLLLVWTNETHLLYYSGIRLDTSGPFSVLDLTYGVWFWVDIAYSYLLILFGTLLLLQAFIHSPPLYRRQVGALLLGAFIPWVAEVLLILDLSPFAPLDLTPFAFILTGLVFAWGLFRLRLLDIVPVARDAVIEGMSDGVIVLDTQNRIVDLNPAAGRIIGHPASEAIGQLISIADSSASLTTGSGLHIANLEVENFHSQIHIPQSAMTFDLRISPLHDRRERLTGRLVVLRDITERKRAEEALKGYSERLEERVEQRTNELQKAYSDLRDSQAKLIQLEKLAATGRLAASVAHEINNPLQGISNYLAVISEQVPEDHPLHDDLEMVKLGFERISEIVRRLRAFYRPAEKEMEPTDINGVVTRVLALLGHQLSLGKVEVKTKLAEEELPVLGSAGQLEQVLVNLVVNAQEAMPQGGVLTVRTALCDDMAQLQVSDTGRGMGKEQMSRLFKPFYSGKEAQGLGLGLWISHNIIEGHGGQIEVESQVGQGTTFTISLPAYQGER
jgi:PAS domain S-box-containing protein